jgi:hypothetical protein
MKEIKLLMIIILISVFFSIAHAQTWEGIDYYLYYGDTGKDVSIAWADPTVLTPEDPFDDYDPLKDIFELIIYNKERDYTVKIADIPADQFEWTFKVPKIGHWVPKIRVKRVETVDGVDSIEYTEWSESIDSTVAQVDGVDRGWWLFTWLAPTGPIIIP